MRLSKALMEDSRAVSGIIGETLLTCIVVLMLGTLGLFVFSNLQPPPQTFNFDVEGWANPASSTLYIRHCGGEEIDVEKVDIVITINEDKRKESLENISKVLEKKGYWELGELVEIDMSKKWGIKVKEGDCLNVYIINKESTQLIQKLSLSPLIFN
ncbi:MAG: type IV pilin N-terminal domain-containing protein [Methanosarcinaceae archaeon]|nr:type IV pilin N-terminal domain-containing protein [Methanosarcinaceae archaeon]